MNTKMLHASLLALSVLASSLSTTAATAAPSLAGGDFYWGGFTEGSQGWSTDNVQLTQFYDGVVPASLGTMGAVGPYGTAPVRVTLDPPPASGEAIEVTVNEGNTSRSVIVHYPRDSGDILHFYGTPTSVDAENLTQGAGYTGDVTLEYVLGHQQEAFVQVIIDDIDPAACVDDGDYAVYFNSQRARMGYCSGDNTCRAWLGPIQGCVGGSSAHGLYFPMHTHAETDHYLWRTLYPSVDFAAGDSAPADAWPLWVSALPYGGLFFDPAIPEHELRVRPILTELVQNPGEVIDRARVMTYDDLGDQYAWFGALATVPGTNAVLTPSGLDSLEPTHLDVLPYPSANIFDERMSTQALGASWDVAGFQNNASLPLSSDDTYWVEPNNSGADQFEGHHAYTNILGTARTMHIAYTVAKEACNGNAICLTAVRLTHCIKTNPEPSDFKIVVEGISTRFDHDISLPLTATHPNSLDLTFRNAETIRSRLGIQNVHAEFEADLMPHTKVAYQLSLTNACVPIPGINVPRPQRLTNFSGVDRDGWAECHSLKLDGSAQGDMNYPVRNAFERIRVDPGVGLFTLSGTVMDAYNSTCAESWLRPQVEDAVLRWHPNVEVIMTSSWLTSPSQDEALERLLSPLDLGIETISNPPPQTFPYDAHPLDWASLWAGVYATPTDTVRFGTDQVHGLYAPYMSNAQPNGPNPGWEWPCLRIGAHCGDNPWEHDAPMANGVDSWGEPYDIALGVRPEYINQLFYAQAGHPELLGRSTAPRTLNLGPDALLDAAANFPMALETLEQHSGGIEVQIYATVPPYVWLPDLSFGGPQTYQIALIAPQIVIELRSTEGKLVARFLADVYDYNLSLRWGGVQSHTLRPAFGEYGNTFTTVHLPQGCSGTLQWKLPTSGSCEAELKEVVRPLVMPFIEDALLTMLDQIGAPKIWDQASESSILPGLRNRRYERTGENGIMFMADID